MVIPTNKDVSMDDFQDAIDNNLGNTTNAVTQSLSQMNIDGPADFEPQPFQGHKSTLIFDDDDEISPYTNHQENVSDIVSDSGDENDTNRTITQQQMMAQQQQVQAHAQHQAQHQAQLQVQQQAHGLAHPQQQTQERNANMVPIDITWQQGGEKVYVTGSFTGWRKMIGLVPVAGQPGVLHVKLQLPPGTHKFRFIVDNELRFSDFLPTATDQMGNFVNYLEAVAPQQVQQQHVASSIDDEATSEKTRKKPMSARSQIAFEIEQEPDDMGDGFTRFREEKPAKTELEYTQDIPAVFTDPTVMEQYYLTLDQQQNNHQNLSWLTPPQLPPHLENVILNSYSNSPGETAQNNSGSLPIPNHVVLNHLATSSIKHNTLCVASIVRYKRKYVTQILYAPLQ